MTRSILMTALPAIGKPLDGGHKSYEGSAVAVRRVPA